MLMIRFQPVIAAAFAATIGASALNPVGALGLTRSHTQQGARAQRDVHDFDFLIGEWRVHHRRLHPDRHEWVEFDGAASNHPLMNGATNIEEHELNAPDGAYHAVAIRSYDPKTEQWAIWWLDGRYPSGPLDPPVKGSFENGVGRFYADYTQDGKPMRVRFLWSNITPTSARWEQASSSDSGKTWATNWIMIFQRDTSKSASPAAGQVDTHDFDFLRGDWRVHHRYLRAKDSRLEWAESEGTASHRALIGGLANIEDYTMNAPSGSYRAMALRSYDPKASRWSIWWLDGRSPHASLDPPVQGRLAKGVGTFYGNAMINGKPARVRFLWSRITGASPSWEQAYSADAGKTWETNWIMEFHRVN